MRSILDLELIRRYDANSAEMFRVCISKRIIANMIIDHRYSIKKKIPSSLTLKSINKNIILKENIMLVIIN